MPVAAANPRSQPPKPAVAEVHIRLGDKEVTQGVIVPAQKVAHLPATPSMSYKISPMACVSITTSGATKQQAVGNHAIIQKTKKLPSPSRLGGLNTHTCHGHCRAFSYQFRFVFLTDELTNDKYLVDTKATLSIIPHNSNNKPSGLVPLL
jgi:hypothetical protein